MGQVYLGESPGGEPAAVKVIKPSVVDSETRLRFAQEVEILKTVWGARIAALLDADPEADPPWLATEYVEGLDLSRHVARHGPLDALLTASLGATLAEALAMVHKQGLLHRDLKPANVLLGPNGPKVIDFGLAVFAESRVSLTAANTVARRRRAQHPADRLRPWPILVRPRGAPSTRKRRRPWRCRLPFREELHRRAGGHHQGDSARSRSGGGGHPACHDPQHARRAGEPVHPRQFRRAPRVNHSLPESGVTQGSYASQRRGRRARSIRDAAPSAYLLTFRVAVRNWQVRRRLRAETPR